MEIGTSIGGYKIVGKIGEGGMGAVWLARHDLIGRQAAIKVLHPHMVQQQDEVDRFFREAKVSSQVKHPGIIEIYDFGHTPDGAAYIVMEYLEGEALEDRICREGSMKEERAMQIIRQIAGALGAAHKGGVIHRDLKPENIFLVKDDEVAGGERAKILDFGIAKLKGSSSKTSVGALIGTPDYMAPEQCRGAGYVDHRADFYALGCMLYRMLTGRPPFVGEGIGEVLAAHLHKEPPSMMSLGVHAEDAVETFVLKLLSKDRELRPNTAGELIEELDGVWLSTNHGNTALTARSGNYTHAMTGTGVPAGPAPSTISATAMELPGTRGGGGKSNTVMVAAIAGVVLVAGAGLAVFGLTRGETKAAGSGVQVVEGAEAAIKIEEPPPPIEQDPVKQVTIVLNSEPEGADVFNVVDRTRVGTTPYTYTIDPVEGELVYMLMLDGFKPQKIAVSAKHSVEKVVVLQADEAGTVQTPKKRRSGKVTKRELAAMFDTALDDKAGNTKTTKISNTEGKKKSREARAKRRRDRKKKVQKKIRKKVDDKKDDDMLDPFAM